MARQTIRYSFSVALQHRGRWKTFLRWAETPEEAVEDARDGFQWAYGYWNDGEARVTRLGQEEEG